MIRSRRLLSVILVTISIVSAADYFSEPDPKSEFFKIKFEPDEFTPTLPAPTTQKIDINKNNSTKVTTKRPVKEKTGGKSSKNGTVIDRNKKKTMKNLDTTPKNKTFPVVYLCFSYLISVILLVLGGFAIYRPATVIRVVNLAMVNPVVMPVVARLSMFGEVEVKSKNSADGKKGKQKMEGAGGNNSKIKTFPKKSASKNK